MSFLKVMTTNPGLKPGIDNPIPLLLVFCKECFVTPGPSTETRGSLFHSCGFFITLGS